MKINIKEKDKQIICCDELLQGQFAECISYKYGESNLIGTIIMGIEGTEGPLDSNDDNNEPKPISVIICCPKHPNYVGTNFTNTAFGFRLIKPVEFIFQEG